MMDCHEQPVLLFLQPQQADPHEWAAGQIEGLFLCLLEGQPLGLGLSFVRRKILQSDDRQRQGFQGDDIYRAPIYTWKRGRKLSCRRTISLRLFSSAPP